MRHETRDTGHETRDTRHETNHYAWRLGVRALTWVALRMTGSANDPD